MTQQEELLRAIFGLEEMSKHQYFDDAFEDMHLRVTALHIKKLHEFQETKCAVCQILESDLVGKRPVLFLDHDHESNEIRGFLCHQCNLALGWYEKDKLRFELHSGIFDKYLTDTPVSRVNSVTDWRSEIRNWYHR